MAARTKSKVTPKYKTQYRVKNWSCGSGALKIATILWFFSTLKTARDARLIQ